MEAAFLPRCFCFCFLQISFYVRNPANSCKIFWPATDPSLPFFWRRTDWWMTRQILRYPQGRRLHETGQEQSQKRWDGLNRIPRTRQQVRIFPFLNWFFSTLQPGYTPRSIGWEYVKNVSHLSLRYTSKQFGKKSRSILCKWGCWVNFRFGQ